MNTFDKIAGYEKEKEELATLVEIFNNRQKYEQKGATLPRGIVFYGEAGTGKTLFAEVLSEECSLRREIINLADSVSEVGICRQIRRAFRKAEKSKKPTMIFFDELDKVLPNADEEYCTDRAKSILAQLLTLIDGMEKATNVVFVATCNNFHSLPPSITRPGRFDKKICLGLPTLSSRVAILDMYIGDSPARFDMSAESIAKLSAGFSCAALKTLVNECLLRSDKNNFVSEELIRSKILEIKEENIPSERSEQSYAIDSVRNVGSFIISRLYSGSGYLLTMDSGTVSNGFLDGIISAAHERDWDDDYDDEDERDEEDESAENKSDRYASSVYSNHDYIAIITALLGGFAAEELVYGKTYDNLGWIFSLVENILSYMAKNGMLGIELAFGNYEYPEPDFPPYLLERLHHEFERIKRECYERAKSILSENVELITKLAAALANKKSIEKPECERLLEELGGIVEVIAE